jgi:hypothetical protein
VKTDHLHVGVNRSALCVGMWLLLVAGLPAAEPARPADEAKASDDELRIKGVFDSALPGTEKKHHLKLIVHPHFGDFHRHDNLRVPLGLRYGINERWEVTGEVEAYFSHGFGDTTWWEQSGFSNVHFGTKYQLATVVLPGWETAVGFDYLTPVGNPPTDISDGLSHFSYYTTFSRNLPNRPDWRVFWGVGADNVSTTGRPVVLDKNDLGDDSVSVSGGFVWQRKALSYTLEMSYASTRLTGVNDRDVFTIRPGIVWKIPPKYIFNAKGRWLVGVGTRISYGADGADYGISAKLRGSFDFKNWWRRKFSKESK